MPIYEYQCRACGHRFEEKRSMRDETAVACPTCRAQEAEQLISATSFQLKGGGWYASDYQRTGGDKRSPATGTGDARG